MLYWVAHLKDGQTLDFRQRATYINISANENAHYFMTNKFGYSIGLVPNDNLLWAELIEIKED